MNFILNTKIEINLSDNRFYLYYYYHSSAAKVKYKSSKANKNHAE